MGLFRKNKAEQLDSNSASGGPSKWEQMAQEANRERAKRENAERQQRKIIAALLLGNGGVDPSPFDHHDVAISEDMRQAYLDKVVNGEIGNPQYKELLRNVGDPYLDANIQPGQDRLQVKAGRALDKFSSAYEYMILQGVMSGGQVPDRAVRSDSTMESFYQSFENPVDFDMVSQMFLMSVGQKKPNELADYTKAMKTFKKDVYGKKQEYWDQIQELRNEATDYTLRREKQQERMRG